MSDCKTGVLVTGCLHDCNSGQWLMVVCMTVRLIVDCLLVCLEDDCVVGWATV